jgi:hypothetical protein
MYGVSVALIDILNHCEKLFQQINNTTMSNYSFETSLPAYLENKALRKKRQCDEVLAFIKKGANNLLQISNLMGIPQSIVSARMTDLMEEKRARYEGKTIYNNRERKRIIAIKPEVSIKQAELF